MESPKKLALFLWSAYGVRLLSYRCVRRISKASWISLILLGAPEDDLSGVSVLNCLLQALCVVHGLCSSNRLLDQDQTASSFEPLVHMNTHSVQKHEVMLTFTWMTVLGTPQGFWLLICKPGQVIDGSGWREMMFIYTGSFSQDKQSYSGWTELIHKNLYNV